MSGLSPHPSDITDIISICTVTIWVTVKVSEECEGVRDSPDK